MIDSAFPRFSSAAFSCILFLRHSLISETKRLRIPEKKEGDPMPARCALFAGLTAEQTQAALRMFSAREKAYGRGEILKQAADPLPAFGLVLSGRVAVAMADIDGREMLLAHVSPGQTFGEALCYLKEEAPIVISALTDARVLWLRCDCLRDAADDPLRRMMQSRFTAMLCRRTLQMNDRIQILSRGSIRQKLIAFFTECARDAGSPAFTVPFDRAGMAAYLAVDRSALSRELSHMRREGLLTYQKNAFTLHLQQTEADECDMIPLPAQGEHP